MRRLAQGAGILAASMLVLGAFGPGALSVGEETPPGGEPSFPPDPPVAMAPIADCRIVAISSISLYNHPVVKARWDRALAVAPQTCLMPLDGDAWECYYSEAVPGLNERLCFYPVPADLLAGAPPSLDVIIDLASLRALAERSLELAELRQLMGEGHNVVDVEVGNDAARFVIENFEVVDAFYLAPPPLCTPFDQGAAMAQLPLGVDVSGHDAATLGLCATAVLTDEDGCEFVEHVPGSRSLLCWWGVSGTGGPDYRFVVSPDVVRAVLNSADPGKVAKAALSRGNIVIWADDLLKRAALKAALDTILSDVPDLTPPPQFEYDGRMFTVALFPRDGVLTPCARDGQGTWYWLNEFGVPNGFVGTTNVEGMKRFLAAHPEGGTEEELLNDLYLNWLDEHTVTIDGVEVDVEYIFVPGSPFSILPVAKKSDGTVVKLNGDGTVKETLTVEQSNALAKSILAADEVAKQVDFNAQPGTLSQDLKFLTYAVEHNPAAPQIAGLLLSLANGTKPVPEDVAGLFPPESPRLALGEHFSHGNVTQAVADGDAYILGMAAHHLLWTDLLKYGAIQPDEEVPQ